MSFKTLLAVGLAFGVYAGAALGQTTSNPRPATVPDAPSGTTPAARNPMLGHPGHANQGAKPGSASARAAAIAKSDKQPPGTENGNQPDRAAAGGGAR